MWKKIMVHSGLLSVFLFFSFFISCFLASSPSYAISDLVITIDSSTDLSQSSNRYICGGSTNIDCSQWDYVIFSFTGQSFSSGDNIEIRYGSFYTYFYPFFSPYMIQQLDNFSSGPTIYQFNNFSSWLSSGTFTITLTSSLPSESCPEPEEPESCPVIPENPYDDKFDKLIQAIYVCAGVMLVLYFFYCIYRLIIRNSGVK